MPTSRNKAGRLFHFAFNLRERPGPQNPEYAQLIDDYLNIGEMRLVFDGFVDACHLDVLEISKAGVFLAAKSEGRRQGSAFCFRLSDYKSVKDVPERVLQGVIQLLIASYTFPSAERLDDPVDQVGPPIRVPKVVDHLEHVLAQFRASEDVMSTDDQEQEPIWRQLRSMLREIATDSGRHARNTLMRNVQTACDVLEREGFFRKQEARPGDPEKYIPLPQYRVHVRHLAEYRRGLFDLISNLRRPEPENA